MTPKRILFVVSHPLLGGAQRYLIEVIEGLNKKEYKPVVLIWFKGMLINELRAKGLSVYSLNMPRCLMNMRNRWRLLLLGCYSFFQGYNLFRMFFFILSQRIHLIYNNNFQTMIVNALPAKLLNCPSIWQVHAFPKDPQGKFWYKLASFFPEVIIGVSKEIKKNFIQLGVREEKVKVVPNGVRLPRNSPPGKTRKIGKELVVTSIGHLRPEKGFEYLIKAAKGVLGKYPKVKFIIIGEESLETKGRYQKVLRKLIQENGLEGKVILKGYIENLNSIFEETDILAHPSLYEGFGRVLIEAMVRGKPVVASRVGAIPEIVTSGCGILVPPCQPSALAKAITWLLERPEERKKMGANGKRRVSENFLLEKQISKIEKIIKEILEVKK